METLEARLLTDHQELNRTLDEIAMSIEAGDSTRSGQAAG